MGGCFRFLAAATGLDGVTLPQPPRLIVAAEGRPGTIDRLTEYLWLIKCVAGWHSCGLYRYGSYSYSLYRYGLYTYGLCSYSMAYSGTEFHLHTNNAHSASNRAHNPPPTHAPTGWRWSSTAVDSRCSVHIVPDANVFLRRSPSAANIMVAHAEGLALLHSFGSKQRLVSLSLTCWLHMHKLKVLLSVSALKRVWCGVHLLHLTRSHTLRHWSGRTCRMTHDGLYYLDFLIPVKGKMYNTDSSPLPRLHDRSHAHFVQALTASDVRMRYVVDICAGAASALKYHATDNPHGRLLAIDTLEPDMFYSLSPEHLWHRI